MAELTFIRPFSDLRQSDRGAVGGKGASLGELTRAGIRVPPGFVIATSAFEEFLGQGDAASEIRGEVAAIDASDASRVALASERIRRRAQAMPIPAAIDADIRSHYRALSGGAAGCPVAVRSSATCEDSETASFAGLQDTYLWVVGEEQLLDRVRACWASIYNSESITYRQRLKLPEPQISMAVVVQRMVDALCAGVMFTRSPTTGDKSVIVIEGSFGLGSSIVSGEVTPDRFVVNKVTGEINARDVSVKALEHVPNAGGGVCERPIEGERQATPCLSDEAIAELWRLARRVEQHYRSPQDIEWAISKPEADGGRGVYLLQSRPETVWSGRGKEPVARPTRNAFDHVLNLLGSRKS